MRSISRCVVSRACLLESPLHSQDNPLDRARLDLATLYTVNGLMWMKLRARGEDPSAASELLHELVRVSTREASRPCCRIA